MEALIADYVSKLQFGKLQQFKNMGVIPLLSSTNYSIKYLTLKEALDKNLLSVTEVTHGGSVPELKVANRARIPVLLLAGEELAGAKQNRVLNTTILLNRESETVIPVSCTEHGRWSYVSEEFESSEVVASPRIRVKQAASIAEELERSGRYASDQGAIWGEIEEMSARAGVSSATGAMKDVYEHETIDLEKYLNAFKYVPHQRGLLVFVNGKVAAFDVVSLESAYEILHTKLVKSYAMEALLRKRGKRNAPSVETAKAFLEETTKCRGKKYKSVGNGWDYRFEGKRIVGSALVYRKEVVHVAFFRTMGRSRAGEMAEYRQRRDFMQGPLQVLEVEALDIEEQVQALD